MLLPEKVLKTSWDVFKEVLRTSSGRTPGDVLKKVVATYISDQSTTYLRPKFRRFYDVFATSLYWLGPGDCLWTYILSPWVYVMTFSCELFWLKSLRSWIIWNGIELKIYRNWSQKILIYVQLYWSHNIPHS